MTTDASTTLDAAFVADFDRLVRLASLIVGADAEDAVMDAFLRVRSTPRDIRDLRAYLRTSVVNECRSRWRRDLRTPRLVRTVDSEELPELDSVWSAVAALPGDQRAVVALRYYEDLTVPQISATLRMPEGTVKSHLHRAIRALRDTMGDST